MVDTLSVTLIHGETTREGTKTKRELRMKFRKEGKRIKGNGRKSKQDRING